MQDAESVAQELDSTQADAALTLMAQAATPPADPATTPTTDAPPANLPPEAEAMCILTAEDATLSFAVAAKDPDGDPLSVVASQPESGRTEVGPDGILTFVADEPGLQSFQYAVQDGRGGSDTADATVFVNPLGEPLIPPVLSRVAADDLPSVARACVAGIALESTTLAGSQIQIQDPVPGQRFQIMAEPGQQIELQSRDFVGATYLVVDGGLLIVTPDGNMAFVADFVQVAQGDDPLTLSVYEGRAVAADDLLASLQPIVIADDTIGRLDPPAAGPEHGGGAGFAPYDPGAIGTGPDALGPLAPTALLLSTPPVSFESGVAGAGDGDGNQPPTITVTPALAVPVGVVTVTPEFTSGQTFPQLTEQQALGTAQIRGVDQGNFTLGPSADASIIFIDEVAQFENSLGVYLIDPDGTIQSPKMVFPRIELADADPSQPDVRPGGGPLQPGDSVLLSTLYDPAELQEGGQFGLFFIAQGWTLNGEHLNGTLAFQSNGQPATINDPTPQLLSTIGPDTFLIDGNIYHTADPVPGDGLTNPLNDGGHTQTTSGLQPDVSGLTASFEDLLLLTRQSDDDLNDTVIQVDLVPSTVLRFGYVPDVAPDLQINDPDSGTLSRAVVEIVSGQSGVDALAITAPLAGTGISAVEDGSSGRVVLEGDAAIAVYQDILRSIVLEAGGTLGVREVSIQVEDDQGATSEAIVRLDYSTSSLIQGTDGPDTLEGTPGDDPISGLGADDQLFGREGNDLLDGGPGDDILEGGPGSDLLFGGPGRDTVSGDEGADRFYLLSLPDRGDILPDFDATEGDVLDLSALFDGQANAGNIDSFLRFDSAGGNDIAVSADIDGPAPAFDFLQVVTLADPTGVTTVQEAVNSGAVAV